MRSRPKTWAELLHHGKILKKQGNPVGIAISHCVDAATTFWSVLWSHGGKVLEADGKTPAIKRLAFRRRSSALLRTAPYGAQRR